MLKSRIILANIGNSTVEVVAMEVCPKEGVISPLLWPPVADKVIKLWL